MEFESDKATGPPLLRSCVEICLEVNDKTIKEFMVIKFQTDFRIHCPPKQITISCIITATALNIHRAVVDHLSVMCNTATVYSVVIRN